MNSQKERDFWLKQQSVSNPGKIFIKTTSQEFSYSQVFELCKKTADYLYSKGIRKGSHVSVVSENSYEFIIVINALWVIGAIPILINSRLQKNEIEKLLIHSDSKFLINIRIKVNFDKPDFKKVIDFSIDKIQYHKSFRYFGKFELDNNAVMIYSSGSTGEPKLVQLTFNNIFSSFVSSNGFVKHTTDDIWLASLPFYHVGGFSIITRTLLAGCTISIPNSLRENDLLESFNNFKPSLISLVPTMLQKVLEKGISVWEYLRIIFLGGGPAEEKIVEEGLENKFPITLVYGSTETSSMVTYCSLENLIENGISAGKPFPNVKLKIINEKGKELKNDQIGEIVIHSGSVAKSYYKYDNLKNLQNGIYFTNDSGKIDENGNLHIIGRNDDIIISGGENVSLNEIEKLINRKFNFKNMVAIGIKDEKWGQSYVLVIESQYDEELKNEVQQFLKTNLASFKFPQNILFIDKIPKTELGKIKKRELANLLKLNVL